MTKLSLGLVCAQLVFASVIVATVVSHGGGVFGITLAVLGNLVAFALILVAGKSSSVDPNAKFAWWGLLPGCAMIGLGWFTGNIVLLICGGVMPGVSYRLLPTIMKENAS